MSSKIYKYIILLLFIGLVSLPLIVQGNLYFVGGDDMRLYYIFPEKYLENFAFNIISDNTLGGANTGYYPTSQMAPMLYVILFLKKAVPFLNTQHLMYGLNYAFAFLFFYLFLSVWFNNKTTIRFLIKVVASLFYVFSPLIALTLYKNQLIAIYLVSIVPTCLFFFSEAVINKKYFYSVIVALIISVFSTTLNTLPWLYSILITGIPFFIYIFWSHKKSFLINTLIFFVVFIILNFHWIFHFLNSNLNNTGIAGSMNYFSSDAFKNENIRGIIGVSTLLSPLEPVLVTVDYNFKQNFSLFDLKNIVFIAVIVLAGIFVKSLRVHKIKDIYFVSLIGFLLSWLLFSPNIGNWGPNLFLKIATTLPFGTMFRNMFDKFSLPFALYYSFSLACGLIIFEEKVKNKYFTGMLLGLIFLIILSDTGSFFKPRKLSEGSMGTVSGYFNDDFSNLIGYFRNLDNESRVLWVPMTAPNYVNVEDKYNSKHYYSGLSPLRILAGRGDYAGRFSFMLPSDVFYGDRLIELLKEKKYSEFARSMQKVNARYVVFDKQILPESMKPYLYDSDMKYLELQNGAFRDELLGEKIMDFGDRYSLYEVNKKYLSDRIYLTDSFDTFPDSYRGLKYEKVESYLYKIHITNLGEAKKLVFLDPYYKDWVLYLDNGEKSVPFEKYKNVVVQGWANGWEINPNSIIKDYNKDLYKINSDGGMDLTLSLYFKPETYSKGLFKVSIIGYILSCSTVIMCLVLDFRKKYLKHA